MMNRTETTLIGDSEAMRQVRKEAELAARFDTTVLIEGETGCGKDVVATLIHQLSGRAGNFVPVNVAAFAETMFEAQMFGHYRGAFSGAISDQVGCVKEANRGTLFLDEIGSLAMAMQAKLLRVLETKRVRPIGSRGEEPVTCRIVAASNTDLQGEVEGGRFRSDLLYRLCDWRIYLPPLRERPEDVEPLTGHFLQELRLSGLYATLGPSAIGALSAQVWPGNVRQLRQTVRRAAFMTEGHVITASAIALALAQGTPLKGVPVLARQRNDLRIRALVRLLESVNWDTAAAAKQLGVTRKTIYARLQKFGLEIPRKHQRRVCDAAIESGAA